MDLSIVIVNWNTLDLLRDCLESVFKETAGIRFEVIVVDNGSTDGSIEMVKKDFPDVRLIENHENRGYSTANNQGIELAEGRYICLLNSDTVIIDNALAKLNQFLDGNAEAGAITCLLVNPDGSPQFGSALGETNLLYMLSVETGLYKKFPKSRVWGKPFLGYLDHSKTHELEVCPSAVITIRREVFENTGLLDENIFFGTIDWDYSLRMRRKGWKLFFLPEAKVLHYGGKSKDPIRKELLYKDYVSRFYYFWKHYGWVQMNMYRLLILLMSICKLVFIFPLMFYSKLSYGLGEKYEQAWNQRNKHLMRLQICLSWFDFK